MNKALEAYLAEVREYLVTEEDVQDILDEIRSHILEKCSGQHGGCTEEAVQKVLKDFGSAIDVAKAYSTAEPVIPAYMKRVMVFYTGVLFAIHVGLTGLSVALGTSGYPFFYHPTWWQFLAAIPWIFVFDFGLVALGLSLMSHFKKAKFIPLPSRAYIPFGERKFHPILLVLQVAFCGVILYIALQPQGFEDWLRSLFEAREMAFVPPSTLFSGLYLGIALSHVLDVVFYFTRIWFRKGFLEFLKMIFSITILQYILSTELIVQTDLERLIQNIFRGLILFGFVVQIIGIIGVMIHWVVTETKEKRICAK